MDQTIAILGAGKVGTALARTALDAGYRVVVAGSGATGKIALTAEILMPGAIPLTAAEAAAEGDIVLLAVPLHKYASVDPSLLRGKIVVDLLNYWAPVNGDMPELDSDSRSTSEVIAEHFEGARMVKTLNHLGYHEIEQDAVRDGAAPRRALAVATDDPEAGAVVSDFLETLGFDAVNAGPLENGRLLEPGQPAFGAWLSRDELEAHLRNEIAQV